ncbi:MAG: ribonuclease E/G [Bradymonadaceae bacterium]
MANSLVVNTTSSETRVALVEDGIISEFHIERKRDRDVVGNIYKGKVQRVIKGLQAAFVDVAQEKAGFLHVSDFYDFSADLKASNQDDDLWPPPSQKDNEDDKQITNVLNENDEILVQVDKEPIGSKGARLTGRISVPGRYVVFMPTVSHIGVSRRINSESERDRLRNVVQEIRPPGTGFIVRTVSEGVSEEKIKRDIDALVDMWETQLGKSQDVDAPYLLYEEPDLLVRATRDLFTSDFDSLIVDDEKAYERVQNFVEHFMPDFEGRIELYEDDEPVFDAYGIETEINRALSREVELESGGHLVIDRTEALTTVDVNTGSFTGSKSHQDTILKTNMEAAKEVVYQVRLRNIGGIIIIDFIDMEDQSDQNKVYQKLEEELEKDRVTTNALSISEFGLVEMTRKRVRESLVQFLCEPCPACGSRGFVKSKETVAYEIMRELKRKLPVLGEEDIYIHANSNVVDKLRHLEKQMLNELENSYDKTFHYHRQPDLDVESFEIRGADK